MVEERRLYPFAELVVGALQLTSLVVALLQLKNYLELVSERFSCTYVGSWYSPGTTTGRRVDDEIRKPPSSNSLDETGSLFFRTITGGLWSINQRLVQPRSNRHSHVTSCINNEIASSLANLSGITTTFLMAAPPLSLHCRERFRRLFTTQ